MARQATRIPIEWPNDVSRVVRRFSDGGPCVWLDGSAAGTPFAHEWAGWSAIATRPLGVLEQSANGPARLTTRAGIVATADDGWRLWRDWHTRAASCPPEPPADGAEPPGVRTAEEQRGPGPGWFGYVGYEMAGRLERVPVKPPPHDLPDLYLMLCDAVVVLDHARRRAELVCCPTAAAKLGETATDAAKVAAAWNASVRAADGVAANDARNAAPRLEFLLTRDEYLERVARIREYIAAGDIYQANFAQAARVTGLGGAWEVYERTRRTNPAPFAALVAWDDAAVLTVSPELFLHVDGGRVLTRPIKGTRARSGDPAGDAARQAELLSSEKDAAELAMIVDLHRNDLGRVCATGSVRVRAARRLESHPTVFHTVAEIEGRLAAGRDALDVLQAAFPAGSISGAPKLRAMEIIAEVEPIGRGAYCGALGWLGLDGRMTMNVAIRTLQMRGTNATLYAGGGIVADSTPEAEYEETLVKVGGLLAGLGL